MKDRREIRLKGHFHIFTAVILESMLLSMTGFGRSEISLEGRKITVEIKSLNSKTLDLSCRVPVRYKEKELDIRRIISEKLVRGKVEIYINCEQIGEQCEGKLNSEMIQAYMASLKNLAGDGPDFEYLKMAVRMPEALISRTEEMPAAEWKALQHALNEAIARLTAFRKTEGGILAQDLQNNIRQIRQYTNELAPYEKERLPAIEEKFRQLLQDFERLDESRFYQEMAYFTEKLDISEEKVRLAQHLDYYEEVMNQESSQGKKLGFIAQEIGREINTLGSKANHAEIQKLVVKMKDELEKIKEQGLNVL